MPEAIKVDTIQYYWDIGTKGAPAYERVTEDTAFNPSVNREKYSPKYKCNKVQPEIAAGKTSSIDVDIDVVDGQALQAWLIDHEDDDN